jgi:8-oxo-dGTP pyrophosphatase MutT (NUDIX family)
MQMVRCRVRDRADDAHQHRRQHGDEDENDGDPRRARRPARCQAPTGIDATIVPPSAARNAVSPERRERRECGAAVNDPAPRRKAAVAVAVGARPPHGVIFVERASHLRDHPGQIGLPGGRVDAADGNDLQRTVLRELDEEIGVTAERVTIVGTLAQVSQRVNTFDVTPFVAVIAPGPFTIDGGETAGMFTIPLTVVLSDALRKGTIDVAERVVDTYLLDYDGRRIWGLTGRILRSFAEAWNDPHGGLRAALEAKLER